MSNDHGDGENGFGFKPYVNKQTGEKTYLSEDRYASTCYAYLLWHGQAKPFTAVQFAAGERDTILTSVELPWSNPLGDGVAFPEYDGVYFVCDDGEILYATRSEEHTSELQSR